VSLATLSHCIVAQVLVKLPLYLTISAAAHLAIAAVVEFDPPPRKPEVAVTTVEIVAAAPPPAAVPPVAVQRFEEPKPTPSITKRSTKVAPRAAVAATSHVTTGGTGTAIDTGPTGTPGTEPGQRSKYLDMRRGTRADLTLPAIRDDLDRAPAGTAPQVGVAPSGELESAAGGRKKSDQNVFTAKVERDGSVKLKDKRNLSAELSWNPAKLLSGRFDITDYMMRKTKNDPYASRKLKFLDDTRDERVELGKKWRAEQLQQTAMIMKRNLAFAWNASADPAARKQALFELWDEIVEPKSADDQIDEVLVEASRAARKAVVGFIRGHLPAGTPSAYSTAELVAFNAKKQSAATFAPYE
jgi:hypothetical protein